MPSDERPDHDILIEIRANVENLMRSFNSHISDSANIHAKLESKIENVEKSTTVETSKNDGKLTAVHRRVDGLQVTGILTVVAFIITMVTAIFVKGNAQPKEMVLRLDVASIREVAYTEGSSANSIRTP